MGTIKHHAIVVTATYPKAVADEPSEHWIDVAHREARRVFGDAVTEPTPSQTNGTRSFLIAPDGSKEWWDESDAGDRRRAEFVRWLRAQAYDDGSCPLTWAELFLGSEIDEPEAQVIQSDDPTQIPTGGEDQ